MPSLREQLRARAEDRCEYCRLAQAHTVLPHEMDHIRAEKHRGKTSLDNLCWACAQCNASEGPNVAGYDPVTDNLTPLFNPRTHNWAEHFEWQGARLIGKTPAGRATIEVLTSMRAERVEQPRLLLRVGELF